MKPSDKALFLMKVVKYMWEEAVITTGQKNRLNSQISKKWDIESKDYIYENSKSARDFINYLINSKSSPKEESGK